MACLIDIVPGLEKAVENALKDQEDLVSEYVIIRTCNRLEAYVSTDRNEEVRNLLDSVVRKAIPFQDREYWYFLEDKQSIKHLFTVVCGIDSLIVGEDQIQHQIRESYAKAVAEGHVSSVLKALFDKAIVVGKRVRTETDLNKGAVSVGSAAIELAEQKIGTLAGKNVAVFGAGDMAGVIAKNLAGKGPQAVIVSNRTFERAQELAKALGGTAVKMDRMDEIIGKSDLILVATSAPHAVVKVENVQAAMKMRPNRQLLIVDVSVPLNVAPEVARIPHVALSTMDSLNAIAAANVAKRKQEISSAEKIIGQELKKIDDERKEKNANDLIRRLGLLAEEIRRNEAEAAKVRIHTTGGTDEVIDSMSKAIVKKISADFIKHLREAAVDGDTETCAVVARLFCLEPAKKE